ncbi:MAG TPA: 6-phosphogluconolactonase [Pyrinomonadaceae bacterium]|nr:6-phosphogluconolactonase [Pyrinomonadaceae bacterium]
MIKIFPNIEELNNFAAEKFVEIAKDSIEMRGVFSVALAGGSTPKALYRLLASNEFRDKIDWSKVFFFFGDERNVLPDDADSNFRMADENLFKPLTIKAENIFRWQTELGEAEIIAENYEQTIRAFFNLAENGLPRFDLILLGMGADGHTASLFPFTEALRETEKIAAANFVEKLQTTRLTLTFPVVNNARNVIFLAAGEEKAETLKAVLEGEFAPEKLPSQNVRPKEGELYWLIDKNVAKLLGKDGN